MRTLYNLPDGDVEDINKRVASQVLDDDQPNKSYLTISQVCPFCPLSSFASVSSSLLPPPHRSFHHGSVEQIIQETALTDRLLMRNWLLLRGSRIPSTARLFCLRCRCQYDTGQADSYSSGHMICHTSGLGAGRGVSLYIVFHRLDSFRSHIPFFYRYVALVHVFIIVDAPMIPSTLSL